MFLGKVANVESNPPSGPIRHVFTSGSCDAWFPCARARVPSSPILISYSVTFLGTSLRSHLGRIYSPEPHQAPSCVPLSQTTEHIQKRQWTNDLRAVNKHRMNVYHTVVAAASTKQGPSAQGLRSFATNRKRARRGGSQTKMGPPSFLENKL